MQKIDPVSGRVLEIVKLSPTSDPDPHGMCIHEGYMYYCDAGLTAPAPAASRRWSADSRWHDDDANAAKDASGRHADGASRR